MDRTAGLFDYFSVLVIGNNPEKQISKFDTNIETETPYILYDYKDLNILRNQRIKFYTELYKNTESPKDRLSIERQLIELKNLSDTEYYSQLGEFYGFDNDNNIISNENPDGKWITCDLGGRVFSDYLLDFNGNGIKSSNKKKIDWNQIHLNKNQVKKYRRTWELCVNKLEPENDNDLKVINNMSKYKNYFNRFKDIDDYVNQSCSFWTYAIVKDGVWNDIEDKDQNKWVVDFYDNFISNLDDNELITIYECTK